MQPIVLDFETFYGDGYSLSLKEVTTESYVRDPRFKAHGVGIKVGNTPSFWVSHDKLHDVLPRLHLEKHMLIGHNCTTPGTEVQKLHTQQTTD